MNFTATTLVLLLSCLLSAMANPVLKRALSEREIEELVIRKEKLPTCSPAGVYGKENGILLPKKGAKLETNKPFQLYYCSPTYHSTRSVSYDVVASNNEHQDSGIVLASAVTQPILNVTLPDTYYNTIAVFERQTGYGGDQFAMFRKSVKPYESS
ncbi:unnamed protein product [Sympodiomycopsis kandeliae]